MHESSLSRLLLQTVLERAATQRAQRVTVVHGWVAEEQALSPESLRAHFDAAAEGTIAHGAELDLRITRVSARCGACGLVYLPERVTVCPRCSSTWASLTGRTGIGIESIEVEVE